MCVKRVCVCVPRRGRAPARALRNPLPGRLRTHAFTCLHTRAYTHAQNQADFYDNLTAPEGTRPAFLFTLTRLVGGSWA